MSLKRLSSRRLRERFTPTRPSRVRVRRNPASTPPADVAGGAWRSRWTEGNRIVSKFLLDFAADMKRLDPNGAASPSEAVLTAAAHGLADTFAAVDTAISKFPNMPSQEILHMTREDENAADVVEDALSGVTLGAYASGDPAMRKVADNTAKRITKALEERRAPLIAFLDEQTGGFVGGSEEAELEAEVERQMGGGNIDIRGDIESGAFTLEDEPQPGRRPRKPAPEPEAEEDFTPSEGQITVRKKRQAGGSRAAAPVSRQVGGYEQQIVKKRRNDLRPSPALLAAVAKDVLIFELDDGTAQVWPKGTITHTFGPTRGRSAAKTAVLYARAWREAEGAPKSRLKSRIVYSRFDDADNFVVVEEGQTAAAPVADTRSLAERAAALRNNPFYRHNGFDFGGFFGSAKKKASEGAAAAGLAARKAAHAAKIAAVKASMLAERQRVRSAYSVLGPSMMEVSHGNKREFDALDYVMGGEQKITGSGFDAKRRNEEGYFASEKRLRELEATKVTNPYGLRAWNRNRR
jgi:hypothetical protein